jgi:hypothetical protein
MYSALLGLVLGAPAAVVTTSIEKKLEKDKDIKKEDVSKGVDDLQKSGAVDRMKDLLKRKLTVFR